MSDQLCDTKPSNSYLEPGCDVNDLHYTTKQRLTKNQTMLQQAAIQYAAHSLFRRLLALGNEYSVPLASLPQVSDPTLQPQPTQGEEPKLNPGCLLALAVNFAIEYALPWKAPEALQRLLAYVLRRSDLPVTKFLFRKNAGISIDAAKFHFYCINCKSLV